jgi:hypothetical protein
MGEYAIRKRDGQEIKIGTCERMYYLRYEDRQKVRHLHGNVNAATDLNLFWRLPFPDEDHILPGNYDNYNRGWRLWKKDEQGHCYDYSEPELAESQSSIIQLRHESGLLINVPCHHGEKLPELGNAKAFWNDKSWSYELVAVKNTAEGVFPIFTCRHCRSLWRGTWEEILPYVADKELHARLSCHVVPLQAA